MKKLAYYFLFISLVLISCSISKQSGTALPEYIIIKDSAAKILKGKINRSLIEDDAAFGWFKENMKWGTADKKAVEVISKNLPQLRFVVFAGTWCEDTQSLLPVFFRMLDKAGFDSKQVLIYGTDRDKKTLKNIQEAYKVSLVPTFIVYYKEKEIGRVVEYGKYGSVDKEIGEIIEKNQ